MLVHGNLSTGRFFEHLMSPASDRFRFLAPDMRGFGRTEPAPIDATRGLGDWADDLVSYLDTLGVERPHLVGWSTAGAAIALVARQLPVASLTFLDPVSPYGYGGTFPDGTPCCGRLRGHRRGRRQHPLRRPAAGGRPRQPTNRSARATS